MCPRYSDLCCNVSSGSISGISPLGPSCIELAEDTAYLNYSLRSPSRVRITARGLGRVRVSPSTLSLQVRPTPHARREGALFLSPSPAVDAAPFPHLHTALWSYIFPSPSISRPRTSACGWFFPPPPLPASKPYRPPLSAQSAFDSSTILFLLSYDILHEFRRSCLQ